MTWMGGIVREEGVQEGGIYVYIQLIHFVVQQKHNMVKKYYNIII